MDNDLNVRAPRRNRSYSSQLEFDDLCQWAERLDWRNNDAHFLVLAKHVVQSVDDELQEKWGKRVGQSASSEELLSTMRQAAGWYKPQHRNIFVHLRLHICFYLGDKMATQKSGGKRLPDYKPAPNRASFPP